MTVAAPESIRLSCPEAVLLGVVQGVTEFVPVSSSAHLLLLRWLGIARVTDPRQRQALDAALHLGTAAAAAVVLRRQLRELAGDVRWLALLAASTVPAVVVGGGGAERIAVRFGGPDRVAGGLAAGAVLLALTDACRPQRRDFTQAGARDVAGMAVAQAVALVPGVSRCGATLTAARACGLDRSAAAQLSFLMALPISVGAAVRSAAGVPPGSRPELRRVLTGTAAAGLVGTIAARDVLRRAPGGYTGYAAYRLILAAAVAGLAGRRPPSR